MKEKKIWITIPSCAHIKELKKKEGNVKEENLKNHLWFEKDEEDEAKAFLEKLKSFIKENYPHKDRAKWLKDW